MGRFRIHFADGKSVDVSADNGTAAKASARALRGLTKTQCQILRVDTLDADSPATTTKHEATT